MLREEGLALGLSSGLNGGAMRVAKDRAPPHRVTILCDGAAATRRMFNVEFLERGLPHPPWLVEDGVDGGAERDGRGGRRL